MSATTLEEGGNADERVLKCYNGHPCCHSSANRRLKLWMKKHGWDRLRACHEMRAYNDAMVTTMIGSLYETQKRLRHRQSRTTERSYADLVAPNTDSVSAFPRPASLPWFQATPSASVGGVSFFVFGPVWCRPVLREPLTLFD